MNKFRLKQETFSYFLDDIHRERFLFWEKTVKEGKHKKGVVSALYILSAIPFLEERMGEFYSISENYFSIAKLRTYPLSFSERVMMWYAMNLCSGHMEKGFFLDPHSTFGILDKERSKLLREALFFRFKA